MSSFDEDLMAPEVNFPSREFFYTLDQVCQMLDVSRDYLTTKVAFFYGRSTGSMRHRLKVVNIAAPDQKPIWRVAETDFKLWLRVKGIKFSEQRNVRLSPKARRKSLG